MQKKSRENLILNPVKMARIHGDMQQDGDMWEGRNCAEGKGAIIEKKEKKMKLIGEEN